MSDSGYPQSEHSGSVSSRKAYVNDTRSRNHPYNHSAVPRPNYAMNVDYAQNTCPNYGFASQPPVRIAQAPTTQHNGHVTSSYYQDNTNVMVVHSEAESDRDVDHAVTSYSGRNLAATSYSTTRSGHLHTANTPRPGALPVGYGNWYATDRYTGRSQTAGHHVDKIGEEARKKVQYFVLF